MGVELEPSHVKETKWWEYAVRFLFGGVITACTGLVSRRFGPGAGGLFLAFPAILPASLTLVKRHDGRRKAADDARGAAAGSVGLAAFGAVVAGLSTRWHPALVLACATALWLAVSVAVWALAEARKRRREEAASSAASVHP